MEKLNLDEDARKRGLWWIFIGVQYARMNARSVSGEHG